MTPDQFVSTYHDLKASAILRTSISEAAKPAMEAAVAGGFRIVEFTLTTPGALDLISEFSARDGLIVGAGTVLSVDDVKRAADAGARFLVSPVMDVEVIIAATNRGLAMMPGTHTATEMLQAHRAGAPLCKLFPAPGTGPSYVKSILGPMPFLRIVPTNGVHLNNAASYLKAGAHAVGFTTALFDTNDLVQGAFERTEEKARKLLEAVGVGTANTAVHSQGV